MLVVFKNLTYLLVTGGFAQNMAFSPPYKVTACHSCLKTPQLIQISRKNTLVVYVLTYVAVWKAVCGFFLSERTRVFSCIIFFSFVYLLNFFVFFLPKRAMSWATKKRSLNKFKQVFSCKNVNFIKQLFAEGEVNIAWWIFPETKSREVFANVHNPQANNCFIIITQVIIEIPNMQELNFFSPSDSFRSWHTCGHHISCDVTDVL